MLTVAQVADIIDQSPARVRQMLEKGILKGQKHAGVWLIEEKAMKAKSFTGRQMGAGRPKGAKNLKTKTAASAEK